jgi:hypothetical protein
MHPHRLQLVVEHVDEKIKRGGGQLRVSRAESKQSTDGCHAHRLALILSETAQATSQPVTLCVRVLV